MLRGDSQEHGIFRRGSGQRKIYAAIQRLPRGPRGVVEGGLGTGDWYDLCRTSLAVVYALHPWCLLPVSVFFRVLKSTRV